MAWPLTWVVVAGTLPGVFIGYYVRVLYLPDPRVFKLFVGCVLLYIGLRLLREIVVKGKGSSASKGVDDRFKQSLNMRTGLPADAVVKTISISLREIRYEFWGESFSFNPVGMSFLAFVVGIIGGAYGIGGGSIIAPFCVAVFHLPVYTIAGAALMGTFITSLAGAIFFTFIPSSNSLSAIPDWQLGILFGVGGFVGMYLGARTQRFVPQWFIKIMLGVIIISLSLRYIFLYFG